MGKRKLTGSERELHKKATAIRKRFSSMNDAERVEMFAEIPKATDTPQETASDIISEFIERLSAESIWGIGKITIKKIKTFAEEKGYI